MLPTSLLADIDRTFRFEDNKTYQTRCHEYIANNRVQRGYDDTAVQATVLDLCERAFMAGRDEGRREAALPTACDLMEVSARLAGIAHRMGWESPPTIPE